MIHLPPTQARETAALAFPSYKGRTYRLDNSGAPVNVRSYWAGGSRDYYAAVNLSTGERLPVPANGSGFDGGPIAPNGVTVPPGYLIAQHSISCGVDMGITLPVPPGTALAFLPSPETLTASERLVLDYTSRLKNTYAGETDIRYRQANRDHGIAKADWETAKAALISRRLLNKAGAITVSGRNAL